MNSQSTEDLRIALAYLQGVVEQLREMNSPKAILRNFFFFGITNFSWATRVRKQEEMGNITNDLLQVEEHLLKSCHPEAQDIVAQIDQAAEKKKGFERLSRIAERIEALINNTR